ncbi:hypothetical protein VSP20_06960 [Myroides phaeus]|uniref:hypothetical protein n=1 Tax=Myroides phaeus TaxID=702745 RepID=UPI002DBCCD79|nr:hypothetical protein [Myroides phaeus]MEC4116706.1 hypothetical protein [Myroides phaeus]
MSNIDNKLRDKYYQLISLFLESRKFKKGVFSRVEIIQYINSNIYKKEDKIEIDFFFDEIIKGFFLNFATDKQKEILESYLVKTKVESDFLLDALEVDTMPVALDIYKIQEQRIGLQNKFEELNSKTPVLSIVSFNNSLEKCSDVIANLQEEQVFSITGSSKVEAVGKNAKKVYDSYVELITASSELKYEIQRLFTDFSELRDNLRYLREDYFYIVKLVLEKNLVSDKLEMFDFDRIKWLEYATIQSNLDLEFNNIKSQCSAFYDYVENNLSKIGDVFNNEVSRISKNFGKSNYSSKNFKTDLVASGVGLAFSAVTQIFDSRSQSKVVVENLRKDIESLKLSFSRDKLKLQTDLVRLIELYNTVKNTFLPTSMKFSNLFYSILENECSTDLSSILKDQEVERLVSKRRELLQETRVLELYLIDKYNVCRELKVYEEDAEVELANYTPLYNYALEQKPDEEQSLFLKIITLNMCTVYLPLYLDKWRDCFVPIEKVYLELVSTYDKKKSEHYENYEQLKEKERRQRTISYELKDIEVELKKVLENLNYGNALVNKVEILEKLANTSKLILETSIHENLIDPESYSDSLFKLGVVGEAELLHINNLPDVELLEIDEEENNQILALTERMSKAPSLTGILQSLGQDIYKEFSQVKKSEITLILNNVVKRVDTESPDMYKLKSHLIDEVVNQTGLQPDQVNQLLVVSKQHLQRMVEVYKLREEIKSLEKYNHYNEEKIQNQMMIITQVARKKIDIENITTMDLFNDLQDESMTNESKLDSFDTFLSNQKNNQ